MTEPISAGIVASSPVHFLNGPHASKKKSFYTLTDRHPLMPGWLGVGIHGGQEGVGARPSSTARTSVGRQTKLRHIADVPGGGGWPVTLRKPPLSKSGEACDV